VARVSPISLTVAQVLNLQCIIVGLIVLGEAILCEFSFDFCQPCQLLVPSFWTLLLF